MQPEKRADLSVVIPVYGCTATLRELHRRLTTTLSNLVASYEIVLVDDRGPADPWPLLEMMAGTDRNFVAIRTCRNVGQQLAIAIGLQQCCGRHAVVMDCDLQDPPEMIGAIYASALEGFEIVVAKRTGGYQPNARAMANRLYVRILRLLTGRRYDGDLGSFSLVSREAIERFMSLPQRGGHYSMILLNLGLRTAILAYERQPRRSGRSSFSAARLLRHALSGLVFATASTLMPRHDLARLVERRVGGGPRVSSSNSTADCRNDAAEQCSQVHANGQQHGQTKNAGNLRDSK